MKVCDLPMELRPYYDDAVTASALWNTQHGMYGSVSLRKLIHERETDVIGLMVPVFALMIAVQRHRDTAGDVIMMTSLSSSGGMPNWVSPLVLFGSDGSTRWFSKRLSDDGCVSRFIHSITNCYSSTWEKFIGNDSVFGELLLLREIHEFK